MATATTSSQEKQRILFEMCDVLNRCNILHWITDGTLLGYYREGNILAHDQDVDIAISISCWREDFIKSIVQAGFTQENRFGTPECGLEYSFVKDNVKVDLFFFYHDPVAQKYWHAAWTRYATIHNQVWYKMLKYSYNQISTSTILWDGVAVSAPSDIEQYLIAKYGPDWQIPKIVWDWRYGPSNVSDTNILSTRT